VQHVFPVHQDTLVMQVLLNALVHVMGHCHVVNVQHYHLVVGVEEFLDHVFQARRQDLHLVAVLFGIMVILHVSYKVRSLYCDLDML